MSRSERPAPLHAVPLVPCVLAMSVLLVAVMLLAVGVGSVRIPFADSWRVVTAHLTARESEVDFVTNQILWEFRVPRVLLAALCGAGLAVTGVVLQALVANPLADAYMLGIASGASFGAVLVIALGSAAVGGLGASAAAFLGALAAMLLVFALGQQSGRLAPVRVVLAGIAVAYLFLSATSYVQLRSAPNELAGIMFWLLGSVAGAQWDQLAVVTVVIIGCIGLLVLLGRQLNALTTGEESAGTLGIDVRRLRIGLLVVSSLLTGTLVAVAGGVGFVGLMIPHLVRLTFGIDHRRVLPLAALFGALYLVAVDLLSRTVDSPNEMPLGIFTAAIGAPFLAWLLRRNRGLGVA